MPRYTFEEGTSSKFWQIEIDGSTFTVVYGKIGTAGQSQTKSFGSDAEAQKEYDKLVKEKTKKGYALDGAGASTPAPDPKAAAPKPGGNLELEAAIAAHPDDANAYLVYADWLQTQNDKLGEYVALAARGATDPMLRKMADKMLKENTKAWIGSLAEEPELSALEWANGFIHTASVTMEYEGEPHAKKTLGALLKLPTARFLQDLTIALYYDEKETYEVNYSGAAKLLVANGPLPTLRSLFIGAFEYPDETEISWAKVGNVAGLWALYPNLETLRLRGGQQKLGELKLPNLKSFLIETGGLDVGALRSICKAEWPKIESLSVWVGREDYGWNGKPKDFLPLLQRTDLPKLKHLGIKNNELGDEIATMIVGSPLVAQLDELDLSMSTLGDEGAEVLIRNAAKLSHLKLLDVTDCYISDAVGARLEAALPKARVGDQREPDEYDGEFHRYSSIGE